MQDYMFSVGNEGFKELTQSLREGGTFVKLKLEDVNQCCCFTRMFSHNNYNYRST